ncbi:hypothetical protein DFP94_10561 [Fontibacillus phaseoli]|uniref:Uncharacterized protein n=1 Tax=Fontibacillus phaseoli TaxID=1416533 RepID=A0A369BCH7_9BACL|nr:hypothetical protein DFP94_10561 [Fontibacillus phaseoli]
MNHQEEQRDDLRLIGDSVSNGGGLRQSQRDWRC